MLPPEYFDHKEDRLLELYRQLENFILKDITRRLLSAGEMTATADRLIWKLKQMGESQTKIEIKLRKMTGLAKKELRALLQDAVIASWKDDNTILKRLLGYLPRNPLKNPAVIRIMDAEYKKSLGELENLTRTTMKQSQIDLINMLNEADLRVAAGVQSYSAAVCDILDRYSGRGIYVDYPSGARRTLEAAVRCCVVTSMNQTAAQVTNQYIVEAGAEYVLVSAHLGARVAQKGQPALASHADWQGKVYKIRGTTPEYPNLLEQTGYDVDPNTGQGTVKNPLGLHGYNCRHSHKPWDPRLRNPYVDEKGNLKIGSEENKKRYELQQKQRAMERSLRAWKRKLIEKQEQINNPREDMDIGKLQQEYDRMAYQLTQKNKAYNDFCKQNDLQPQYDRIKVADFGREQTKWSNAGAKRYKSIENSVDFDTIKTGAKSGALTSKNDPDFKKRDSFAEMYYREVLGRKREYEIKAVAKNSGFSTEDIDKVFSHVFEKKHLFADGTIHKFSPDYDMAQSWVRLREGKNIQEHDIILLNHELMEANIMGKGTDIPYEPAHEKAQKQYNYAEALKKYLKENNLELGM